MLFLVRVLSSLPATMDPGDRANLIRRERERGEQLRRQGVIAHIWRIPGTMDNVGVWDCASADEVHEAVQSLPAYPWMHVEVTALATHPLSAVARE